MFAVSPDTEDGSSEDEEDDDEDVTGTKQPTTPPMSDSEQEVEVDEEDWPESGYDVQLAAPTAPVTSASHTVRLAAAPPPIVATSAATAAVFENAKVATKAPSSSHASTPTHASTHAPTAARAPSAARAPVAAPAPAPAPVAPPSPQQPEPEIDTEIDEDLINFLVTLLRGVWLVKHAASRGMFAGRPSLRFFWLDTTQEVLVLKWAKSDTMRAEEAQELGVGEITRVAAGMGTDALLRSGSKDRQHLYFSLITADRSLDFECDDAQQRDLLFAGFARIAQQPRLLQDGLIFIVAHGIWVPPPMQDESSSPAKSTRSSSARSSSARTSSGSGRW